jgi:excisionase family DNA binding protein
MKRLLRLDEAASLLDISPRTIYRLVSSGDLPALKVRGGIRIDTQDLNTYIEKQKTIFAIDFGFSVTPNATNA